MKRAKQAFAFTTSVNIRLAFLALLLIIKSVDFVPCFDQFSQWRGGSGDQLLHPPLGAQCRPDQEPARVQVTSNLSGG